MRDLGFNFVPPNLERRGERRLTGLGLVDQASGLAKAPTVRNSRHRRFCSICSKQLLRSSSNPVPNCQKNAPRFLRGGNFWSYFQGRVSLPH